MNVFQIALLIGAVITALISYNLPHALLWICLAGANVVVCDIFYSYDLPYPAAFTLAADALLCLLIHWLATEKWEIGIYIIYCISVLVSVLKLWGALPSDYIYRTLLECINWAALFLITGTAILGKVGASGSFFSYNWRGYVWGAYHYLRRPRKTPHWSRVR